MTFRMSYISVTDLSESGLLYKDGKSFNVSFMTS